MHPELSMVVENLMTWLQLIITVASVATLVITVGKAANKPNQTQNQRLDALEEWRERVDARLDSGNDHFDQIDKGNRITQEALLALMAHAINGNDINKLKSAKDKLENYLIEK